jgi:hypothetical protein
VAAHSVDRAPGLDHHQTALCTYFDSAFLPRGLALYESLGRHWPGVPLYALCLDGQTEEVLRRLALSRMRVLSLADLEKADPALGGTRASRSRVGYYLTCTPALLKYVLGAADVAVYLDADLFFFSSPEPVLKEFSEGSIYVHEHRPGHPDFDPGAGRFNVGLVGVRHDAQGMACVDLWRARCLEWCEHDRVNGHFGDQQYLDEWPDRFDRLVVSRHKGVGAGPWNMGDNEYRVGADGAVLVDDQPLVFFHFTRLQEIREGLVRTYARSYASRLPPVVRRSVYRPYLRTLQAQAQRLRALGLDVPSAFGRVPGARDGVTQNRSRARAPWRRALTLAGGLYSGELMISRGQLAV